MMLLHRKALLMVVLAIAPLFSLGTSSADAADPLVGDWVIKDDGGSTVGTLGIRSLGPEWNIAGTFRVWFSLGGSMGAEGPLRVRGLSPDAIDLEMRTEDMGSPAAYRLLLARPQPGQMEVRGSYHDGEVLYPVRAIREGSAASGGTASGGGDDDFVDEDPGGGDLPGVGVSGPAYRLIGVPPGKRLVLRQSGDRNAPEVGSIPSDASEILVRGCEPYMEAFAYEALDAAGKRRVLDSSWCEIDHEGLVGFTPGRYLEPIDR